jgi:VWFA-related protein
MVVPVEAERVEVDLVVRDEQGALVRDLRADELELLEDGVRQRIDSLDLVSRTSGAGPVVVALAFDHLGPTARRFARAAALELLDREDLAGLEVGVFSIDRELAVVQPFTSDAASLRAAVDAVGAAGTTTLAGKRERELTRNAYHGLGEGFGQAHVASAEMRGAPECREREEVTTRLTEMLESRLVEGFASLERDQQGFTSTHGLLGLVGALGAAPGRKAVVLFSEGLAVPANVDGVYRSLIGAANRARVSLYTVDVGGLRVESPGDDMRRALDNVRTRMRVDTSGGRLTDDSPTSLIEKVEDALRLAPASTLRPLADQTAGFTIGGTNELAEGLARLREELREHHLLSYSPSNRDFDGRFRAITVRVKRPHRSVQSRKGYLAVAAKPPVPAVSHEAAALARLGASEAAGNEDGLPLHVRGLQFPEEGRGLVLAPVLVALPSRALRFERDAEAGVFRQDFTVVALVRGADGEVVAKASQHYPVQGPLAGLEQAQRGQVLFYREVRLPAGSYTLEAVALDTLSGRSGVARASLVVPETAPDRLRASSLVVVERAEKAPDEAAPRGPLYHHDVILYPALAPRERQRDSAGERAFFLRAWPAPGRSGLDARVEILSDGRPVAAAPPFPLRPEPDGRVSLVSTVSVGRLPPGDYQLRVTLSDGTDSEARTADLAIGE